MSESPKAKKVKMLEPVINNTDKWLEENSKYFLPPVCNKMISKLTMVKSYSCVLCLKTHLKESNRRKVENSNIRNYLERTLKRNVDNCCVCLKCRAQLLRDIKKHTSSPKLREMQQSHLQNDNSDFELIEEPVPTELASPKSIELHLSSSSKSHRRCTVCKKENNNRNRQVVIPIEARTQTFIDRAIIIPVNSRCCPDHLLGKYFTQEAINLIPEVTETTLFSRTEIKDLFTRVRSTLKTSGNLDFDNVSIMSDEDYRRLTGLTRDQFTSMSSTMTDLRSTDVRSVRTCLGIFLVKMRTGLSNTILATLFSLDVHQIQRAVHSARSSLMKSFVPSFLGFPHMPHDKFTKEHTTATARALFADNKPDTGILVLDGTYIYIQKSSHHNFQRQTYSMHKGRSLVKPMMLVGTDGYILNVLGPYYADGKNNDASIIKHAIKTNSDEINEWLRDDDVMVVDRGFRDAEKFLDDLNFKVEMPSITSKGSKQQTTEEANTSRLVTKVRWVVESANGRIKQWRFLDKVVPNHYVPHIGDFVRIVCSMINCFRPPLIGDFGDDEMATKMIEKARQGNHLKDYVIENNLTRKTSVYTPVNGAAELPDFPRISVDKLRDITMGIYQIKSAKRYTDAHHQDDSYMLSVCKDRPDLLRVKMHSRHSSSKSYNVWLEFSDNDVTGWYCSCKVGSRVVGCCAHVASIIWYLGYHRWTETELTHNFCEKFTNSVVDARHVPESSEDSDVDSVEYCIDEEE